MSYLAGMDEAYLRGYEVALGDVYKLIKLSTSTIGDLNADFLTKLFEKLKVKE